MDKRYFMIYMIIISQERKKLKIFSKIKTSKTNFKIVLYSYHIMINIKRKHKIKNQFLAIAKSFNKIKKNQMKIYILLKIKKEER